MAIGPSGHQLGPWVEVADAVYKSVTSGTAAAKARALKSLETVGKSRAEAKTIYATAASIAKKADSRKAFISILKGEAETPIKLAPNEIAMLSNINRRSGVTGRTWEGSGGDTWQGSGGDTWQGTSS